MSMYMHARTHTHRCAFTNLMCFSLTATVLAKNLKSPPGPRTEDDTATGESCVRNLPKPIHIAVILNWHFHRKEHYHFVVNVRPCCYDAFFKSGVYHWLATRSLLSYQFLWKIPVTAHVNICNSCACLHANRETFLSGNTWRQSPENSC